MKSLAERLERLVNIGGTKKDAACLILSGGALLLSIFDFPPLPFDAAWIAILLCGVPIVLEAVIGLITSFDIKADVLVSLALIASLCIGEEFAAGEVAFIMQLGALLEDITVAKARAGIEKLAHLTPQKARVLKNGKELLLPAEAVQIGDVLRVLPGESIPVDGVLLSGQTAVNQAVMTGESLPVDKAAGDQVFSGTVNEFGVFEMKAAKVGQDSSIQRMIRLVQSADAGKAKIVGIADRWAAWIVAIALTAAVFTWFFTGEIIRAVTILVVFCPCALVLATPTAIMAAIGNATKHGFLIRQGDALERLAKVKKIAFDKTGTLTHGMPKVVAVKSCSPALEADEIYAFTAAAEQFSEHPLGKAVAACYKKDTGKEPVSAANFQMLPGRGVRAAVKGKTLLAGNARMFAEAHIEIRQTPDIHSFLQQGCTVIYIALEGSFAGFLVLSDALRSESRETIGALSKIGVPAVLLTGDNENAAQSIANQLHITEVCANCLPEDKMRYMDRSQKENRPVCMMGDGINERPRPEKGGRGDRHGRRWKRYRYRSGRYCACGGPNQGASPSHLPFPANDDHHLLESCVFHGLNLVAILLAISGMLNPVVGALVHNAGSVAVIANSALLLKWKKKR